MKKNVFRRFSYYLIVGSITYVVVELICFIFIAIRYIPADLPSFSTDLYSDILIADVSPYWGVWHPYPVIHHKVKHCFDKTVYYNSYGARDVERATTSTQKRCVVLGDSFLEGFGVDTEDRVSNLLEDSLKQAFMNFACFSMNPTQYAMVYKHLANRFSHQTVLVGLYPNNDFIDADIEIQKAANLGHYKPYWTKNCEIYYWTDSVTHSPYYVGKIKQGKRKWVRMLKNFTVWFNVIYYFKYQLPLANIADNRQNQTNDVPYSGFYDYTPAQFEQLSCSLLAIKNENPMAQIILFTIPVKTDILRYQKNLTSKLGTQLSEFCQTNHITFVDLLPITYQEKGTNVDDLFIPCDGHWSKEGNLYAFKKLSTYFYEHKDTK